MSKKGWISVIFLIYFFTITSWIATLEYQIQKQIMVFINIKTAYEDLKRDIEVMDNFYCNYVDKDLNSTESYEVSEISDRLYEIKSDRIIEIEIDENTERIKGYKIYNY
ncbi:MAG: hypothetical protein ACK5KQ_06740 [Anaerorhabdus sp.]